MQRRPSLIGMMVTLAGSLTFGALVLTPMARSDDAQTFIAFAPALANDELRPFGTATPRPTSTATRTPTPKATATPTPKPDYEAVIDEVERTTYGLYIRVKLRLRDQDGLASVLVDFGGGLTDKVPLPPTLEEPFTIDGTYHYRVLGQSLTLSITTTDLRGGTTTKTLAKYTPVTRVFAVRVSFEVLALGHCDLFSADNELLITATVAGVNLGTTSVYDPPSSYQPVSLYSLRHHHLTAQAQQHVGVTVTVYEQDAFLEGANDFLGTKTTGLTFGAGSSSEIYFPTMTFSQASPACSASVRVTILVLVDPPQPL